MLRAMGVAAVLLSVACAQTNRLADDGPPRPDGPDRGVADREVLNDVGPLDQGGPPGPILDPLELQRTITAGRRLSTRFWRLPDGLEVERIEGSLRDRDLETLCTELPGRLTTSGDIRCVPFENVFFPGSDGVTASGTYADDACTQLTLPAGPAECPARFITVAATPFATELLAPPLVFRETPEQSRALFAFNRGECVPETRDFDAPRPIAEPVADAELVAAEDSGRAFGAVAERTVRWADGTLVVRREPTQTCTYVRSRPSFELLPTCIPGFDADDITGIYATVGYENAECEGDPVLQVTPAGWDEIARRGDSRDHAITLTPGQLGYEIHPLRSGVEPIDDPITILYERTADGGCVGRMRRYAHLARLGAPVPIASFPTLARAELGSGRIRALRWVDPGGVAWPHTPFGSFTMFRDVELDEDCYPSIAPDGVRRCLPFPTARVTGRSPLDSNAPEFADAACTEAVLRNPEDDLPRYATLRTLVVDDSCRVRSLNESPGQFARRDGVYEIGPRVMLDGAFARTSDGRCVAAPGGRFAVLDRVPPSAFAEVEIAESP